MESTLELVKEQIANGQRWSFAMERDFILAEQRRASLEHRMEELEKSTKEQIAGVLQASHFLLNNNIENRLSIVVTQLASASDRLASLEKRMEALAGAVVSDFSLYNNRQASLENRMEAFEKSTKEQIAANDLQENRIDWCERQLDSENHDRQHLFDRIARVDYMIEHHEHDLRSVETRMGFETQEQTARELAAIVAFHENRVESLEKSTKEQIAGVLQALRTGREQDQADTWTMFGRHHYRQANLENRMDMVIQALRIDREQAATHYARQANLENRMGTIEKVMQDQGDALQTARDQSTSDFISADYWRISLKNRMVKIEKLMKNKIAATENRLGVRLGALQVAVEQAAREFTWATVCADDRQANFENCMASIEIASQQADDGDWEQAEEINWETVSVGTLNSN